MNNDTITAPACAKDWSHSAKVSINPRHAMAVAALVLACLGWALSFPLMKGLLAQQTSLTGFDSFWVTNQALLVRYVFGALILAVFACWRSRRLPRRSEWLQALVCAVTSGAGLYLQMEALNRTAASTVAFLTQFSVVLLPLVVYSRNRRWPSPLVVTSLVLSFAGVSVLSGITLDDLQPGFGELMTLAAALMFTLHILAVGAPRWADNDGLQVTWAMFALLAMFTAPVIACTGPGFAGLPACYPDAVGLGVMAAVVLIGTCLAYGLMTIWQRFVSGTEAGIIYCCEAVFAALLCLFLPSQISGWLGIPYADESVSLGMVLGGGLVIVGCVLVQFAPISTCHK